jgi:hypothetical protein
MDPASLIEDKINSGVLPNNLRENAYVKNWLYLEYDKCYNNRCNSSLVTQCITNADKNVIPILDKK